MLQAGAACSAGLIEQITTSAISILRQARTRVGTTHTSRHTWTGARRGVDLLLLHVRCRRIGVAQLEPGLALGFEEIADAVIRSIKASASASASASAAVTMKRTLTALTTRHETPTATREGKRIRLLKLEGKPRSILLTTYQEALCRLSNK